MYVLYFQLKTKHFLKNKRKRREQSCLVLLHLLKIYCFLKKQVKLLKFLCSQMFLAICDYLILLFSLRDIIRKEHICYLHVFTHPKKKKKPYIHKFIHKSREPFCVIWVFKIPSLWDWVLLVCLTDLSDCPWLCVPFRVWTCHFVEFWWLCWNTSGLLSCHPYFLWL